MIQDEFKKLRRQMTCFCTLATGCIFVLMTLLCLTVSESALRHSQHQSFLSDVNSVISYLDNQNSIPYQWLARMESGGKIRLYLYDNGSPMQHNFMPTDQQDDAGMAVLAEQAISIANSEYQLDIFKSMGTSLLSKYATFSLWDASGKEIYAAAAAFPKSNGTLSVVALYPLDRLEQQISSVRRMFVAVDLLGLIALVAFAWLFSGKMLKPIAESRKSQAQFVASASHELRSPLTVILSSLSALETAGPDGQKRFRENIRAEGLRMSRLVDDMLSLASADSHAWTLRQSPVELDTLALEVYERFTGLARERGLEISVSLPEGAMEPHRCDGDRVLQALEVLMDNAISYTPSGGRIRLSIEVLPGGKCQFIVQDTGPGVPDGEKERIFQRFYRAGSSHSDREHFGLGLCVAREIAHMHRGRLWVQDTPGGGAEFHMII